MRKLLIAFLIFSAFGSTQAQSVDEIIAKHIEAMGGKEKMRNVKNTRITMKMKMQNFEIPVSSVSCKDGSMRSETTIQNMKMIQAYDASTKSGWYTNPMMGDKSAQKMNEEMLKEFEDNDKMESPLIDYKQKGHSVELIGKEDLEGEEVWKIMLTKKNGNNVYYYIDTHNYYIWKQEGKVKMREREMESETYFFNYTTVDGITTAMTTENYSGGKVVMQSNIEKIEYDVKLEPELFKMPADAKTEDKKEEKK